VVHGPESDLHRSRHAVWVARIEPEWRFAQHRRQHAFGGDVEIVGQPALAHKKAYDLFGGADVAAVLQHYG
jgi:hypothetical protein